MADQQHLELLKQGITAWNEWREKHPEICPDLSGANLSKANLEEANLSKANLRGINLSKARLERANLSESHLEEANLSEAHLEEANLTRASLEKSNLIGIYLEKSTLIETNLRKAQLIGAHLNEASLFQAQLKNVDLFMAQLERTNLVKANLKGAKLIQTHLEEANLSEAHLEGAELIEVFLEKAKLKGTYLDKARLEKVSIGDKNNIGPWLTDIHWGDTSLAGVKWIQVKVLGEEHQAKQKEYDDKLKDITTRLNEYEIAVRANRQLAVTLQAQGISEYASHFAYHSQVLQRHVYWFQMIQYGMKLRKRVQKLRSWLFSWFLYLLAGYGYKPQWSLYWYVIIIFGFSVLYFFLAQNEHLSLSYWSSLVFSVTSFHGRGFPPNPGMTNLDEPIIRFAAVEAVIGLIIEISFIATFTQRFLGK